MKVPEQPREDFANVRSSLRLGMLEDEPVYLQVILDVQTKLPLVDLGGDGARILCYACQEFFDVLMVGHSFGHSLLTLGAEGTYVVEPVIRWKKWPCIGVQFTDVSNADRAHIFKFLFDLERKKRKKMETETQQKPRNRHAPMRPRRPL